MKSLNKFLIVDDHQVVRIGMAIAIKKLMASAEVVSVGSFTSALELVSLGKFHVIILDVSLPDGTNLEMPSNIKKRDKDVKVLMFTGFTEPSFAMRYLKSGADGFLSKDASDEEIKNAIQTVLRGELYMSEIVKNYVLSSIVNQTTLHNPIDLLSNRESDILQYVLDGKGVSKIAEDLSLSPSTVSTYKTRIFQKMQVTSLMDLIKKVKAYE